MADPLSFFAVNSDDSDSDEDSSEDVHAKPTVQTTNDKDSNKSGKKVLPPPMDALADAKRPEFTISTNEDLDWDKLSKKAPVVPEKEFKPWENRLPTVDQSVKTKAGKTERTLAQQVPGASAPNKAEGPVQGRPQEYVDHSIQWSKMYQTMDKAGNVKRVKPQEIGGEAGFMYTDLDAQKVAYGGAKRQKMDSVTFRSKEAKKRTLGQSNRDKMFVEEEKRVLRQNFDGNL